MRAALGFLVTGEFPNLFSHTHKAYFWKILKVKHLIWLQLAIMTKNLKTVGEGVLPQIFLFEIELSPWKNFCLQIVLNLYLTALLELLY